MEKRVTFERTTESVLLCISLSEKRSEADDTTLFPVIIEQVLISAYLIKKPCIYTEYMEYKMIFERYQDLFDFYGRHSRRRWNHVEGDYCDDISCGILKVNATFVRNLF